MFFHSQNPTALLYRTTLTGNRLLRWGVLYASLLPVMFLLFALLASLGGRWAFIWTDFLMQFPWVPFFIASALLGVVLTGLAALETKRNNRLWHHFFQPDLFQPLLVRGFWMDRYGIHGYWNGLPLSIYYEKETLGDFAKITAYAMVSDDVDMLRELGRKHGNGWFFLPEEIERLIDPPFDKVDWEGHLDEVWILAQNESFEPQREHPWRLQYPVQRLTDFNN